MIRITIILILMASSAAFSQSIENGKSIFAGSCAICHTIGKGKLLGPDLAGITERREKDWIFSFILNSQEMVSSGDETAKALFAEFNNLPMPSHNFTSDELEDLLAFVNVSSAEVAAAATAESLPMDVNQKTIEAKIEYPMWYIITVSFIGLIILALLIVVFLLFRMTRRLTAIPLK